MLKVYVLGDSISIHYGPYLQRFLVGIMDYARKEAADEARLNLGNPQGDNGGDSAAALAFLRAKAASGGIDADVLLLNCGLHDIKTNPATGEKQVPLEQYQKNLRALVAVARTLKPELVWVRTTPCDEEIHNRRNPSFHRFWADCTAYNEAADRIMAQAAVAVVDLCTFTRNVGPDLYCDHVHFQEHVREKQAAFIAGWLACWRESRTASRTVNE